MAQKDAVPFLRDQGLKRKETRQLLKDRDGQDWCIETMKNKPGKPKVLLPVVNDPPVSKVVTEIKENREKPTFTPTSEPSISVTPMDTGQRETGALKPLSGKGFSDSCLFPLPISDTPHDARGEEDESEVLVERF